MTETNSDKINSILSEKEMLRSLEKLVNKHIDLYPERHLPCKESVYILNESAIIKMATHYEGMFNRNPVIQISALPKKVYIEFIINNQNKDYNKIVEDINITLAKKYKNVLVKSELKEDTIEKKEPYKLK